MWARRKTLASAALGAFVSATVACATVANLDVTHEPGPGGSGTRDNGDASAGGDAPAVAPQPDGGVDAPNDSPTVPTACSCASDKACCVPKSGAGVCVASTGGAACGASDGLFIRCAGGDIANGRVCCFTPTSTATFFAASCDDAGAQVCADSSECGPATCRPIACRGIALNVCAAAAGPLPTCPP